MSVHQMSHPIAQVLLTHARDRNTPSEQFADAMLRIGYVLAVDVFWDLDIRFKSVMTPLDMESGGATLDGDVALVPVLRAGDVLTEGFRAMLPRPIVWHLGMGRDETTLQPTTYLNKVPREIPENVQLVVVLEVMLATGGSACAALNIVKNRGAKNVRLVCVVAAPEGIARVQEEHPDVDIYVVAIDKCLTGEGERFPPGFIKPGLGDAGDRIYATV